MRDFDYFLPSQSVNEDRLAEEDTACILCITLAMYTRITLSRVATNQCRYISRQNLIVSPHSLRKKKLVSLKEMLVG